MKALVFHVKPVLKMRIKVLPLLVIGGIDVYIFFFENYRYMILCFWQLIDIENFSLKYYLCLYFLQIV